MNAPSTNPHATSRAWTALALLAGALLAVHFSLCLQENGAPFLDIHAYTSYTAKRPYQYRTLMAPVMSALIDLFSSPSLAKLTSVVPLKLPTYISNPVGGAYFCVNVVGIAASFWLVYSIARKAFPDRTRAEVILAVYVAGIYFVLNLNPNLAFILPYDIPSLALSQFCIWLLFTRRWALMYLFFALATVNRETCFLVVVFFVAKMIFDPPLRRDWKHAVALTVVWFAIKVCLVLAFSKLESDEGLRIVYNVTSLLKPWQWPALLPLVTMFLVSLWSLVKMPSGQKEWALTGCGGFALLFVGAQVLETRAYADLIVYFAFAIGQLLTVRWSARPAPAQPVA